MSVPDPDRPVQPPNNDVTLDDTDPATPTAALTLPSTEEPGSPIDTAASFTTELNDDRGIPSASAVIPSSQTPPPSSQLPTTNGPGAILLEKAGPSRSRILSPPQTTLNGSRRPTVPSSEYVPPAPEEVIQAAPDELRSMLQREAGEILRLKAEVASLRLQVRMSDFHAAQDRQMAAVEHEMLRRTIDTLQAANHSRQARRELESASESFHARHYQLKMAFEEVVDETKLAQKRLKAAKKIIKAKQDEIEQLKDDNEALVNRIRENREHFNVFRSPGGIFHDALTPKSQAAVSPVQPRQTPRQTPRSARRNPRDQPDAGFSILLEVLNAENNSAPSTPTVANQPPPRLSFRHTRNVQSMSSLPTTPAPRVRSDYGSLLPSADLVPQSEPGHRFASRSNVIPSTPVRESHRKSRESTISIDNNEELARQALQSVAAQVQSFAAAASQSQHSSAAGSFHRTGDVHPSNAGEEEEIYESQASQAAADMLRRDPRESFDVVSSTAGSRDGTPGAAEKNGSLHQTLFAGLGRDGTSPQKRKFGDGEDAGYRRENPKKALRLDGGLREGGVGLGIYGQDA